MEDRMDFEEISLLLEVLEKTNPNLYPILKPIHDAAMERLVDISNDIGKDEDAEAADEKAPVEEPAEEAPATPSWRK